MGEGKEQCGRRKETKWEKERNKMEEGKEQNGKGKETKRKRKVTPFRQKKLNIWIQGKAS